MVLAVAEARCRPSAKSSGRPGASTRLNPATASVMVERRMRRER